jgi:hypothetical protein
VTNKNIKQIGQNNQVEKYVSRAYVNYDQWSKPPLNEPYYLLVADDRDGDGYKERQNYVILLMKDGKPIDIRVVKTNSTLNNFIKDKYLKKGLDILFHPNPVKLTRDFWEKYRQTENGKERLKLFKDMRILEDNNMYYIDTIYIDVDTPFSKSFKVLENLAKELDIDINKLRIIKTKSGNLRFAFKIKNLLPKSVNKNGNTNLLNVKEFVSIINTYFKINGCKADDSFKRINHPVWITKPEEVVNEGEDDFTFKFYDLYRKAKELNRKIKQIEKNKQNKRRKKNIKYLPAFVANNLRYKENLTILEKAVISLAKKTGRGGRYIHFLQVVAGWCKWLGLSYDEYYDLVYEYASDKLRDIKTAWRYARELEFKEFERRKYDLVKYAEKVIEYLKTKGTAERQELLKEVFEGQKWLEQLVMEELSSKGIIKFEFVKAGRGRPKKVYFYEDIQEQESKDNKEKKLPVSSFDKELDEKVFVDGEKEKYFSQYNNKSLTCYLEEVGYYDFNNIFRGKRISLKKSLVSGYLELKSYIFDFIFDYKPIAIVRDKLKVLKGILYENLKFYKGAKQNFLDEYSFDMDIYDEEFYTEEEIDFIAELLADNDVSQPFI